jgi:hypothetical protein
MTVTLNKQRFDDAQQLVEDGKVVLDDRGRLASTVTSAGTDPD